MNIWLRAIGSVLMEIGEGILVILFVITCAAALVGLSWLLAYYPAVLVSIVAVMGLVGWVVHRKLEIEKEDKIKEKEWLW